MAVLRIVFVFGKLVIKLFFILLNIIIKNLKNLIPFNYFIKLLTIINLNSFYLYFI